MEFEFQSVDYYRNKYKIIANFYTLPNGEGARLFADVVRNEYMEAPIDAYLIMINPGSCEKSGKECKELKESDYYKEWDVEEAVSDPAQKCVMAFMDICDINKIRILNLMDYKNGDFDKAVKAAKELDLDDSLFSIARFRERKNVMQDKAVVIAAWGTDERLAKLKMQAMSSLNGEKIIGVKPDTSEIKYYNYRYIKPSIVTEQKEVIQKLAERYVQFLKEKEIEKELDGIGIKEALAFFIQHKEECHGYETCTIKNTEECPCRDVMITSDGEEGREKFKRVRQLLKEYAKYNKALKEKIDFTPKEVRKCEKCGGKDMIYTKGFHYIAWCKNCCHEVGAVTQPQNEDRRDNSEQSNWAKQVYKRDGYQCFICGSTKGIQAHHIIPYAYDEILQKEYKAQAGITLCEEHHLDILKTYNNFRKTGSYGVKIKEEPDK